MTAPHFKIPNQVFVTATGTEVGKTYVSGLVVKELRDQGINAGYFKPALSDAYYEGGKLIPGDAEFVCNRAGLDVDPCSLVSYIYTTPVAPHLAAVREGASKISLDKIKSDFETLNTRYDQLVVEGCGGIVCPLSEDPNIMLLDVIKMLNLPIVIVTSSGLGSINACVLTVEYAHMHNLDIVGIIMNNYDEDDFLHRDNARQIERITQVPVIAWAKTGASSLRHQGAS